MSNQVLVLAHLPYVFPTPDSRRPETSLTEQVQITSSGWPLAVRFWINAALQRPVLAASIAGLACKYAG
jgi:hypothetical protein